MVGKGNLIQTVMGIVDIEGSKSAVAALHADQPVEGALDRMRVSRGVAAQRLHNAHTMTAVSSRSG